MNKHDTLSCKLLRSYYNVVVPLERYLQTIVRTPHLIVQDGDTSSYIAFVQESWITQVEQEDKTRVYDYEPSTVSQSEVNYSTVVCIPTRLISV